MTANNPEYDPSEDEVDITPYEGAPEFDEAPWNNTTGGAQDDEVEA